MCDLVERETYALLGATGDGAVEDVAAKDPASGLRSVADDDDVSVLVVAAPREGTLVRLLTGSASQRLIDRSPCPLLVAPIGYAEGDVGALRCIGVGFDGSDEARAAWARACDLAARDRATVRVHSVHKLQALGAGLGPMAGLDVGLIEERAEQFLSRELTRLVSGAPPGVAVEAIMSEGSPTRVLREVSEELDLLVLGSRHHGMFGSLVLGSVVDGLLADLPCPLMITPGAG
jgi:nucleotide-binding universal stress UspA family protein